MFPRDIILHKINSDSVICEFDRILNLYNRSFTIFEKLIIFDYVYDKSIGIRTKRLNKLIDNLDNLVKKTKTSKTNTKYIQNFNFLMYTLLFDNFCATKILDEIELVNNDMKFLYIMNNMCNFKDNLRFFNLKKTKYRNYLILKYIYEG